MACQTVPMSRRQPRLPTGRMWSPCGSMCWRAIWRRRGGSPTRKSTTWAWPARSAPAARTSAMSITRLSASSTRARGGNDETSTRHDAPGGPGDAGRDHAARYREHPHQRLQPAGGRQHAVAQAGRELRPPGDRASHEQYRAFQRADVGGRRHGAGWSHGQRQQPYLYVLRTCTRDQRGFDHCARRQQLGIQRHSDRLVYRRQNKHGARRQDPAARRGLQLMLDAERKKKGDAMTTSNFLRAIAAAALLLVPQIGWSVFDPVNDDTDIFLANPAFSAQRPNVLIFIDNTANWNQAFDTEKAGLISVFNGLTDAYNVGIAMFVETGGGNDNVDGAYVRFGVRQMTATNNAALSGMVNALDKLGDKGNNATYSLAMGEMYRYFAGVASYSGYGKVKRDYAGNTTYNSAAASLPGNPFTSAASTTYVSPIVNGCQRNFIIFISNGPAGDNSSSLSIAQGQLAALVGKNPPDTLIISPNGEQGLWSDEYAKFMSNSDCNANFDGVQNVYTYTLDVLPRSTGQGPSHTAQLQSMASSGKGKYFAITDTSNTTQFTMALNAIFQEVQAVNSVFASTTLPVSVNVRGTNLNQVYIGVFRPDTNKSPRWLGNLKLYRLFDLLGVPRPDAERHRRLLGFPGRRPGGKRRNGAARADCLSQRPVDAQALHVRKFDP